MEAVGAEKEKEDVGEEVETGSDDGSSASVGSRDFLFPFCRGDRLRGSLLRAPSEKSGSVISSSPSEDSVEGTRVSSTSCLTRSLLVGVMMSSCITSGSSFLLEDDRVDLEGGEDEEEREGEGEKKRMERRVSGKGSEIKKHERRTRRSQRR